MKKYWKDIHKIYSKKDWINKPAIFAEFVLKYFPKKGKLLELGAGQGRDSRFFAKKGYKVVSTDLSEYALKISREKAKKEKLDIQFIELDLKKDALPFKDKSLDIVYSHLALHYFDDKRTREIFKEIHRVLKPNGIVAAFFNTTDDKETEDLEFELLEENFYKSPEGVLKRYFSVDYLKDVTKDLFNPVILDAKGETYKDEINNLIRFIGKKK